ncbi:MAG: response regulator [Chloroflexi bacterium]|nr:response regulator [Chloroflexota bacterium]
MAARFALVVEDDAEIARFFALVLQDQFSVDIARTGREALDLLEMVTPEIIVLDLNIPFVSGVEILRQVRANERLAHTVVIVATANPQMAEEVYDLADLVLLKPVSYDQLRDLVRRFV